MDHEGALRVVQAAAAEAVADPSSDASAAKPSSDAPVPLQKKLAACRGLAEYLASPQYW